MGRRNGKLRRRNGTRRNSNRRGIIETFTFSVMQGSTTSVLVSTLTSRPPRSNFRPVWLEVEVVGYQPGTSSASGWLAPVGCQIGFRSESDGNYASTSRLVLAGATPRKIRTRYPTSSDWWPWNITLSTVIADISAVCVGPSVNSANPGYLRGVARMLIIVQEEQCATSCPAIGHPFDGPPPSPGPWRQEPQPEEQSPSSSVNYQSWEGSHSILS